MHKSHESRIMGVIHRIVYATLVLAWDSYWICGELEAELEQVKIVCLCNLYRLSIVNSSINPRIHIFILMANGSSQHKRKVDTLHWAAFSVEKLHLLRRSINLHAITSFFVIIVSLSNILCSICTMTKYLLQLVVIIVYVCCSVKYFKWNKAGL